MIKLRRLIIGNFKSLDGFALDFSKFTCLIGLNSAGKSTILQAIDFISQLMNGDISKWLDNRGWEANEFKCKLSRKKYIHAVVSFTYYEKFYIWSFVYNPTLMRCIDEEIVSFDEDIEKEEVIFQINNSKYMIKKDIEKNEIFQGDIINEYQGSFLADLKPELLSESINEFRTYMKNIYSLDLLSPQELRKRSRVGSKLGLSGANISAFLNSLDKKQKEKILAQLKKCYPNLNAFEVKKSKGGWSRLELVEKFGEKLITNEAKYLNDGVLRLIAILAQLQTQKSFLLFEEIENGINSELIEFLMDILIESDHQVMITTHSPMILNYIDDSIARESVKYIYKNQEGFTQSISLFDIPSMAEKLEMMGAGSAYVDTDLTELYKEIQFIEQNKEEQK